MRVHRVAFLAALSVASAWLAAAGTQGAPDAAAVQPVKGLVITRTVINGGFVSLGAGGANAYSGDMEEWDSVADATPEIVSYQVRVSAPGDVRADADMKKVLFHRSVRREDIAQSSRISWGISTQDPEMFAGQTYEETSVKALQALKSGAEVPFVIGALDGEDPSGMGALLQMTGRALSAGSASSSPLKGMATILQVNVAHTYYRGSFRRVEAAPVMIPVLLNGVRVSLPTLHAQGTVTSPGGRSLQMQFWWLDGAWPLALKTSSTLAGKLMTEQVTRIDLPPPASAATGAAGAGAAGPGMAEQLRKSCRVELSGIYFNTGSARLLDESRPALQAIAQVVKGSGPSPLVIAGHTDNVGTAEFNQALSEKRAAAVREALVTQFAVPAERLSTRGYGFTKPLESNDTVEGRARNRRVELVCAGAR